MTELVKRRLAAIVAADVVGYPRSVETDEAATLSRVNEVRRTVIDPAIQRCGGRLVKEIGDGLLFEFPSVVDAVRASIEIQDGIAKRNSAKPECDRIVYRIGINVGDVVIENDDLLGDGVNVAARLEALADPGGICLSDSVHQQLGGRLDLPLVDAGPQQLKNIARSVRVFHWRPGVKGVHVPVRGVRKPRWQRAVIFAGLVALALAATAGVWLALRGGLPQVTDIGPPSPIKSRLEAHGRTPVAVLPFMNISGDKSRDYFSDGLTEEVISALGRFSALSVLSRNAVMPFKGKTQAPAETARALGVRYLVEGTVRSAEERVRVSVQLSDASAGRLMWSEQYDGEMRDVITLQERIAREIVGVLAVRLRRAEQSRAVTMPTGNLEAYDLVLRGRAQLSTSTRRANVQARMLFERAIALDARYADAYVGLGHSLLGALLLGWTPDPREALSKAEEAARTAIRLDDRNSQAYALLGRLLVLRQDFDQAKEAERRAIELNPSDAEAYRGLGNVLLWSSEIAGAIDALETALAYDPTPDAASATHLALAYYLADRFEDVINFVEGTVGGEGKNAFAYVVLSMAYAELGRLDKAKETMDLAQRLNPVFDPEQFGTLLRDPTDQAKIRSGLQRAGWL